MPAPISIKILTLFKDLFFTQNNAIPLVQSESLSVYTNEIIHYDMKPDLDKYLTAEVFCGWAVDSEYYKKILQKDISGTIPAGKYLFVQGLQNQTDMRKVAEELWLESLWQEIQLEPTQVFLRKLSEDNKDVFQIFRKIVT